MARKKKWDKRFPIPYTHRNNAQVINENLNFHASTETTRFKKNGLECIRQIIRFIKKGEFKKHIIHHYIID